MSRLRLRIRVRKCCDPTSDRRTGSVRTRASVAGRSPARPPAARGGPARREESGRLGSRARSRTEWTAPLGRRSPQRPAFVRLRAFALLRGPRSAWLRSARDRRTGLVRTRASVAGRSPAWPPAARGGPARREESGRLGSRARSRTEWTAPLGATLASAAGLRAPSCLRPSSWSAISVAAIGTRQKNRISEDQGERRRAEPGVAAGRARGAGPSGGERASPLARPFSDRVDGPARGGARLSGRPSCAFVPSPFFVVRDPDRRSAIRSISQRHHRIDTRRPQ
jgi:hypothetical protein